MDDTDPKFIVRDESVNNYLVWNNYQEFQKWFGLNPTRRTLHEVIIGRYRQKLKFDIDAAAADLDVLPDMPEPPVPVRCENIGDEIVDALFEETFRAEMQKYEANLARRQITSERNRKAQYMFNRFLAALSVTFEEIYDTPLQDSDMCFSNSSDDTKYSRHVVISTFNVRNAAEAKYFTLKLAANLPADIVKFLDTGVNKSIQCFRLPECHKAGSGRIKVITQGKFDDMIITQTAGTNNLTEYNVKVKIEAPQLAAPGIEAAVLNIAEPYSAGCKFHKRVGNLFSYRRIASSNCVLCERVHDADNTMFVTVNNRRVKLHCRHAQNTLQIGELAATGFIEPGAAAAPAQQYGEKIVAKKFTPRAMIPTEFSVERYCEPELREYRFHGDKYDTLLIKSGMGTGKTKKLLEWIEDLPNDNSIIFVSFRCSFTTELVNKLAGFVDYRKEKREITAQRVIVQFESLHRLQLQKYIAKKTILVLDESESIIGQMEHKQQNLRKCWENFQWLMYNSRKVFAMDAFADYRTYTLLAKTRKSVHMHLNTSKPAADKAPTDIYYENRESFLSDIYAAATTAQEAPFVIVSTAKKQAEAIAQKISELNPTARIKSYNSDSSAADRADFDNVNVAWADVDVLIYTSTVSAGCSFELPRFKRIFGYFSDLSCDYKTAIQMLGRVRNVESRQYHIFIKYSASDLPDTVPEIERAVADRAEISNIECNPLNMPKMINSTGQYEYTLKDLFYHLHVGNIVHRCQSRNHFRRLFMQCRYESGVIIKKKESELSEESTKEVREDNQKIVKKIVEQQNAAIAAAKVLDEREIEQLKAADDGLTVEQRNSLTMHHLADCYRVPLEQITPKFVATYNKPKIMSIFHNLNRIVRLNEPIVEAVKKWRAARNAQTASIDDLATSDNMLKCMFGVDILNSLMGGEAEYCVEVKHFQKRFVARVVLELKIDDVCAMLMQHVEVLSLLFDIRRDRLAAPRKDFKAKMELVNSILRGVFGVQITGEKAKVASTMFKLTAPKLFEWNEKLSQYTAAKMK